MKRLQPARALRHPAWWAAVALLLVNDHVLKGAGIVPPSVTGKLSDFAGLFLAPALLAAALRQRRRGGVIACFVLVGAAFTALKVSATAARLWIALAGLVGLRYRVAVDPTDLMALPMLAASWRVFLPVIEGSDPLRSAWHFALERAGAAVGAVGCIATSQARAPEPVFDGHTIDVQHGVETVTALNDANGKKLSDVTIDVGSTLDPLVVSGGVLYMATPHNASTPTMLHAMDLATRSDRWKLTHPDDDFSGPFAIDDRRLYLVRRTNREHDFWSGERWTKELVQAIDRATGRELWSLPIPDTGRPRIAAAKDVVLVSATDVLVAADPETGKMRWQFQGPAQLSTPALAGSKAFVGDRNGVLYALDVATGKTLWQMPTGSSATFVEDYYRREPAVAATRESALFIRGERLEALDVETRQVRWSFPKALRFVASGSLVVVKGTDLGVLSGVDAATGKQKWTARFHSALYSQPVIGEGLVLVRDDHAAITALDADGGWLHWIARVGW